MNGEPVRPGCVSYIGGVMPAPHTILNYKEALSGFSKVIIKEGSGFRHLEMKDTRMS